MNFLERKNLIFFVIEKTNLKKAIVTCVNNKCKDKKISFFYFRYFNEIESCDYNARLFRTSIIILLLLQYCPSVFFCNFPFSQFYCEKIFIYFTKIFKIKFDTLLKSIFPLAKLSYEIIRQQLISKDFFIYSNNTFCKSNCDSARRGM